MSITRPEKLNNCIGTAKQRQCINNKAVLIELKLKKSTSQMHHHYQTKEANRASQY